MYRNHPVRTCFGKYCILNLSCSRFGLKDQNIQLITSRDRKTLQPTLNIYEKQAMSNNNIGTFYFSSHCIVVLKDTLSTYRGGKWWGGEAWLIVWV